MSSDHAKKIEEFMAITAASREIADSLLNVCNDNLEMAINMHMEGVQTEESNNLPGTSSSSASTSAAPMIDEDGVRAPIPPKQEVLIQPGYEGYAMNRAAQLQRTSRVRSVFDGFRNFSNEAKTYERANGSSRGKKRTLEDLFKPPLDMTYKGDFQMARDAATNANKWLMVNIQDACEFQCQVLNRDVWSNEAVKTILREHFIFWQQYKESEDAQRFTTFYPVDAWPYVAILDPRTGEHMVTWHKLEAATFCDLVTEFLSLHPMLNKPDDKETDVEEEEPASKKRKSPEVISILDADEDDQIAAAIRASLAEAERKSKKEKEKDSDDSSDVFDYDSDNDGIESFSTDNSSNLVAKKTEDKKEVVGDQDDWEKYLGSKDDPNSSIMIRLPDGNRVTKDIPCSSQFLAIVKYVVSAGFDLEKHEIVTNFPRRILTEMDTSQTLKELGLFPKEIVFVQQK